jgi:threonyl-tRNA synthetase
MIHRGILGSLERFIAILIEHHAGAFPMWLAPVQAKVIPIASRHEGYAGKVAERLREAGLRVEVDEGRETLGKKVRATQLEKVPYALVVGDKEAGQGMVAVRDRGGVEVRGVPLERFVARASRRSRPGPWRPATSKTSADGAAVGPVADGVHRFVAGAQGMRGARSARS